MENDIVLQTMIKAAIKAGNILKKNVYCWRDGWNKKG